MAVNILIDDAIFRLQASGGISTLWAALVPHLKGTLPDCTFDPTQPADVFLSTYYQPAPDGVPSVVMAYDFIARRYPGLAHRMDVGWQRAAIAEASAVVAISAWTAQDCERLTGRAATIAYPASSLTRASHDAVQAFKARYGLPENYVLMVGNRSLYKNGAALWQAAKMMNPRPCVVCVGGEDERLSSGEHLRLTPDELAAAYTGALCLVYPSLYEGFGLPVLEAYACGCPVVCGDGGALAEINEAARIVNVTRPMEIAQALVEMHDHGVRIEHIMKGYDVAARFHWAAMAACVAAVIRQVADKEKRMIDPLFIASPIDVLRGDAARSALAVTNDAVYLTEGKGVLSVPLSRWQRAQVYERDTWLTHGLMLTEDRNAQHAAMFDGYKALPNDLGDVIELGCGPFTNWRMIRQGRRSSSITLLDPMAYAYMNDHPHCSYRGDIPIDTETYGVHWIANFAIEDYESDDAYDTVIMINVLHHCQSVQKVFGWINTHLKPGGRLVFHEPVRDIDPTQFYDVGHPISFNQGVIDDFLADYELVYHRDDYVIGVKR